jgi:sugar transport protein
MFFLFGTFGWIMGIFVWFFIPETKGISLEKMDELFGVTELAKRLDDHEADIPVTEIREDNAAMKKQDKI